MLVVGISPVIERKTVLLLQDSTRADGVQRSTLRNCGYTVVTATTGKEAVERLRTGPHIDVVLIDINPGEGRDGVEAARDNTEGKGHTRHLSPQFGRC